ncbi:MAG: chemotaxis-specific protein-glutamate methyltransferase CheB [Frankiaceae bacterium]
MRDGVRNAASPGAPTGTAPVGVVVVDDSPVQRRFLRAMIDCGQDLSVVGEARTGREAVALVERLRPAVVLMDLDLPATGGIETIERIMASRPTPILAYSSSGAAEGGRLAAIAAGAVDVVARLEPGDEPDLESCAEGLRRRLRVASRVRVITHPRARLRPGGTASPLGPARTDASRPEPFPPLPERPVRAPAEPGDGRRGYELIAVGVSTGGPQALSVLLGQLPADLAQAVVVVQHMADGFLEGLAAWLDSQCALPVRVGASGKRLQPGTVTVAPGGLNLLVHDRLRISCEQPPPSQYHIPGIDATFGSVAASVGAAAIGVILTGMGRDGAAGLRLMRERGAATIGQDEATSAVYGMPGAAMALGAVEHELPLPQIAPFLLSLVRPAGARSAP